MSRKEIALRINITIHSWHYIGVSNIKYAKSNALSIGEVSGSLGSVLWPKYCLRISHWIGIQGNGKTDKIARENF